MIFHLNFLTHFVKYRLIGKYIASNDKLRRRICSGND